MSDPAPSSPEHLAETSSAIPPARYEELQAVYDAIVDGLVIVDIETGQCLRTNAAMATMLGYTLEGMPRQPQAICRPQDAPLFAEKFAAQVAGRLPLAENIPFLHREGHLVFADVSSRPIQYQGRRCLICFVRDVTERKKVEEALRASEERFRAVFEEAPVGILLVDRERRVARVNRAYCRMLGYPSQELLGRPVQELIYPEDLERVTPLVEQIVRGEMPSVSLEKRYVRQNGATFWAQATMAAVHGPDDQVAFILSVVEDIDERKQAQEAWQREHQTLWRMLRSSDHERQLIAYEIHDGLAQQLAAALMQFESHEHLETHEPAQAKLAYEAGVQMLRQAHFEARRLISGVRPPILDESGIVAALAHLAHEQRPVGGPKVEFQSEVTFGRLAPVLENAIYRIAQEAIANACQHSRSSRVLVKLEQAQGEVGLEIQDWGVGFDPQTIGSNCFGVEGIRERVRLLGGTLRIESRPGAGTAIRVTLPLFIEEGSRSVS